ncbi:hypothetical protein QBC44DRAFT_303163 [Cladorrhinum sp. PSN332]|nr:hypothetical protein QBC44DRAFT_303163 [Cladorrhinum sp. PSN332]
MLSPPSNQFLSRCAGCGQLVDVWGCCHMIRGSGSEVDQLHCCDCYFKIIRDNPPARTIPPQKPIASSTSSGLSVLDNRYGGGPSTLIGAQFTMHPSKKTDTDLRDKNEKKDKLKAAVAWVDDVGEQQSKENYASDSTRLKALEQAVVEMRKDICTLQEAHLDEIARLRSPKGQVLNQAQLTASADRGITAPAVTSSDPAAETTADADSDSVNIEGMVTRLLLVDVPEMASSFATKVQEEGSALLGKVREEGSAFWEYLQERRQNW